MPGLMIPLILSPFIGSFVALLIRRLPHGQPVALARSRCEACGHVLGPLEMIPLLSGAVLRMRCRWCHARFSFAHLAVELACLGIAAVAVLIESDADPLMVWYDCVLGWWLLALAWIDWEHMLLPDVLTLPLILSGLAVTLLHDASAITEHAAAVVVGYVAFRTVELAYRHLRGRDGLGHGDAKLLAAAAAWVGLAALPTVVFTAAMGGLGLALCLRLAGRDVHRLTAIPFGPPLCAAIWVTWLGFDSIFALADHLP